MGAELELQQEDEYSVGALIPYAYYNGWCFPRNMEFYNKFVCMENVSKEILEEWKKPVFIY
ncbi:MAG TPA: hypothetical protein EYP23_03785 [Thermoplasmata archaeon]|nr:hypothetical protein [Thermoplasmata archaeon]